MEINKVNIQKYIDEPNCTVPRDIEAKLEKSGGITKTLFQDKNSVLTEKKLHLECGYTLIKDDYYLVSMYTPMPNVTKEMVEWWFWWHTQSSERYRAWYPKEHVSTSFAKKDKEYFAHKTTPPFQSNTQYPVEKIGKLFAPLSINFVSPEDFGFDKKIMEQNNVETIVCGHVGAFKGLIPNTEMSHIFFKDEDGLLLVSRFWLGKCVKNKVVKKIFVTEQQAKDMAYHCCVEYRNFANKIPKMYAEWLEEL